jgi:hypothetical protein
MKNRFIALLIISSVALGTSLLAGGGERLSSPRAKANRQKVKAGESYETMDRSFPYGSPCAVAQDASLRKSTGSTKEALNRSNMGLNATIKNQRISKAGEKQTPAR